MGIEDVLRLASRTTVARMLERDDFSRRLRDGVPISVMELLYPLLQGWDSVMVESDVELGGTDQLFNNLVGRHFQEQEGQEGQVVLTTPLLEGTDGVQKMSKSLGNYIGIAEPPGEQFGKLMRVPDELMPRYLTLTTGWHPDRIDEVTGALTSGALAPVDGKRLLARTVVDLYHGDGAGAAAEAEFDRVFRDHAIPEDVAEFVVDPSELTDGRVRVARLLALAFPTAVPSNKEGRRKIEQGGVRIDGEVVEDPDLALARGRPRRHAAPARPEELGPPPGLAPVLARVGVIGRLRDHDPGEHPDHDDQNDDGRGDPVADALLVDAEVLHDRAAFLLLLGMLRLRRAHLGEVLRLLARLATLGSGSAHERGGYPPGIRRKRRFRLAVGGRGAYSDQPARCTAPGGIDTDASRRHHCASRVRWPDRCDLMRGSECQLCASPSGGRVEHAAP